MRAACAAGGFRRDTISTAGAGLKYQSIATSSPIDASMQ